MRIHAVIVSATFVATASLSAQTSDCSAYSRDSSVVALLHSLDAVAAVGSVWDNYTLARHPIVLVDQPRDTTRSGCAVIWRYREPLQEVTLGSRIRMSTPLYGMWDGNAVGPHPTANGQIIQTALRPVPAELESTLRSRGDMRAVLLTAPIRFDELGALGKALAGMKADPTIVSTQLAVHESYHLHSQIPVWLDQPHEYSWPKWDVQPDRRMLTSRCYSADNVSDIHRREMEALLRAWDIVKDSSSESARGQLRDAARAYVSLRLERYRIVDTTSVAIPGGALRCMAAEDMMELEEGAPQWMSYDTAVRAGVMTLDAVGRSATDAFYVSGTFQLWILQRVVGRDEMRRISGRITRAASPTDKDASIFRVFAKRVAGVDVKPPASSSRHSSPES